MHCTKKAIQNSVGGNEFMVQLRPKHIIKQA